MFKTFFFWKDIKTSEKFQAMQDAMEVCQMIRPKRILSIRRPLTKVDCENITYIVKACTIYC